MTAVSSGQPDSKPHPDSDDGQRSEVQLVLDACQRLAYNGVAGSSRVFCSTVLGRFSRAVEARAISWFRVAKDERSLEQGALCRYGRSPYDNLLQLDENASDWLGAFLSRAPRADFWTERDASLVLIGFFSRRSYTGDVLVIEFDQDSLPGEMLLSALENLGQLALERVRQRMEVELWRNCPLSQRSDLGVAITDKNGVLWFEDNSFVDHIREHWSQWRGGMMPRELRLPGEYEKSNVGRFGGLSCHVVHQEDWVFLYTRSIEAAKGLTPMQRSVAEMLVKGISYKDIAEQLGISPSTVNKHANAVYTRLSVSGRWQLARLFEEE